MDGMLRRGDLIPRFEGAASDGRPIEYDRVWQQRNVVLFALPAGRDAAASRYLTALERGLTELKPADTSLVVSNSPIAGLPPNTLAIADRWGEIAHIERLASDCSSWPSIDDILEWVEFVRMKCPECPP